MIRENTICVMEQLKIKYNSTTTNVKLITFSRCRFKYVIR